MNLLFLSTNGYFIKGVLFFTTNWYFIECIHLFFTSTNWHFIKRVQLSVSSPYRCFIKSIFIRQIVQFFLLILIFFYPYRCFIKFIIKFLRFCFIFFWRLSFRHIPFQLIYIHNVFYFLNPLASSTKILDCSHELNFFKFNLLVSIFYVIIKNIIPPLSILHISSFIAVIVFDFHILRIIYPFVYLG